MEEWGDFQDPIINDSWFNLSPPTLGEVQNELSSEENKQFENSSSEVDPSFTFFDNLTFRAPSKSTEETKSYYQVSADDIGGIAIDLVEPPEYQNVQSGLKQAETSKGSSSKQRKKRTAWTEEEHMSFLKGVDEYGQGKWKSIARYCLPSKTTTQIASHAQKYYLRQQTSPSRRRRPCINDINNVNFTITTMVPTTNTTVVPTTTTITTVVPITTIATTPTQLYTQQNSKNIEQLSPLYSSFPYNNMMSDANNNHEQKYYYPSTFSSAMNSTTFPQANPQPTMQAQSSTPYPTIASSMYNWSWRI